MRVIIAGAGDAGLSVAAHLRRGGHDVTVIERDEAIARRAFEQFGLVSLAGDATSATLRLEAEVGRADVVVTQGPEHELDLGAGPRPPRHVAATACRDPVPHPAGAGAGWEHLDRLDRGPPDQP